MRWSAMWMRSSRSGRIVTTSAAAALVLLSGLVVTGWLRTATADIDPSAGVEVPADVLPILTTAAASCPALTPPRLAGQVMANSGFDVKARRGSGGSGIAGLTEQSWLQWAPSPAAQRASTADNIVALSHQMCDLHGQIRASRMGGDPWRLALASFLVGVPAVTKAGGVPAGAAANYVAQVESYTNSYSHRPQFGGAGNAGPPASTALQAPAVPVPDAYLQQVTTAGTLCPAVTPPRIAAQLMVLSGFNPNKLGAAGQEGIAQFTTQVWAHYNAKPLATPWQPDEAILVLGRAMCDQVNQVAAVNGTADPYAGALTAFEWGVTSVALAGGVPADADRSPVTRVAKYLPYYAADPRLNPAGSTAPTTSTKPGRKPQHTSPAPSTRPSTPPTLQPPPGTQDPFTRIQAESYAAQSGTTVENCVDEGGGQDVGSVAQGDWLQYDKVDFGDNGATRFVIRLAANLPAEMTGQIDVRLDTPTNAPVGTVAVVSTGGWQNWVTASATISRVTGVHTVYLTFVNNSGLDVGNINWIVFEH